MRRTPKNNKEIEIGDILDYVNSIMWRKVVSIDKNIIYYNTYQRKNNMEWLNYTLPYSKKSIEREIESGRLKIIKAKGFGK